MEAVRRAVPQPPLPFPAPLAGLGRLARLPGANWMAGRPAARQLALLAIYLAAGIVATWPRVTYLAGRLPSTRDSAAYVWGFWWMARQLTRLGNPWFTSYLAAPVGEPLGFHTLMPLPGLVLSPVTLVFGPAVAYNLLVICVPGLLCYTAYRAARLWLPPGAGPVAAGAFYGLSAMLTGQDWYHVNLAAGAIFLPLALAASVRLRRAPDGRRALVLGLVLAGAALTDPELAVLAAITTLLVLAPWLIRQPSRVKLRVATLAAVTGVIIASPQIVAMALELSGGGLGISRDLLAVTSTLYGVGLPGMFSPTPRVADFGMAALAPPFLHTRNNEGLPMFGVVLTVLALAGLAAAWRRRSARQLALAWLGSAMLAFGTSLWVGGTDYLPFGQTWNGVQVSLVMPYTWFVRIPILNGFREADRLAMLGLLPAALLAGAAVNWLRYHARPLIAVVAVLGVMEAGYSGSADVGVMPAALPALDRPIAADHSSSIVVDVPFGLRGGIPVYGTRFAAEALVLATADGHPRAISYVSRNPASTISAVSARPFYASLVHVQHYAPPLRASPLSASQVAVRAWPLWARPAAPYQPLTVRQLAVARADASRLGIGWVIVWYPNPVIDRFLGQTGFRPSYRADGALVYRYATHRG